MCTPVKFVSAVFLLVLVCHPSFAQDLCNAILKNGVFETRTSSNFEQELDKIIHTYCSLDESQEESADSQGADFTYVYQSIETMFSWKRDKESNKQFRQRVCSGNSRYSARKTEENVYTNTASESITKAWSDCMNRSGINFSAILSPDRRTAIVQGTLNIGGAIFSEAVKILVQPDDALDCDLGPVAVRSGNPRGFRIPCGIRPGNTDITITLQDFFGEENATIRRQPIVRERECSLPREEEVSFSISDDSPHWVEWGGKTYKLGNEGNCSIPPKVAVVLDVDANMQRSHPSDFMRCELEFSYGDQACELVDGNGDWLQRLYDQSPTLSGEGSMSYECQTHGLRQVFRAGARVHNAQCDITYLGSFSSLPN